MALLLGDGVRPHRLGIRRPYWKPAAGAGPGTLPHAVGTITETTGATSKTFTYGYNTAGNPHSNWLVVSPASGSADVAGSSRLSGVRG